MAMDLRHLRYFVAVAEEGHITAAAERLGIQQPPLSRLIKTVEIELGVQLFRRKARGVELTEAGQVFRDRAVRILSDLEQAVEIAKSTARGERGRLRIGLTPTGPFHPFVPRVIRAFRFAYPQVSLTLEEQLSSELIDQLLDGRLDVAFVWTPPTEGLAIVPLINDELVVALPDNHLLLHGDRRGDAIALKALMDETFIVYGRKDGFGLFAATIAACRTAGFSPRFGLEATRLASALSLVAAGLGVFFVPHSIPRVQMDGVTFRKLSGPGRPVSTLTLASRRGDPSAVARRFVALVRKAATEQRQ
jgi:DNA-binding transcriptional LysR family regulator